MRRIRWRGALIKLDGELFVHERDLMFAVKTTMDIGLAVGALVSWLYFAN